MTVSNSESVAYVCTIQNISLFAQLNERIVPLMDSFVLSQSVASGTQFAAEITFIGRVVDMTCLDVLNHVALIFALVAAIQARPHTARPVHFRQNLGFKAC